MKKRIPVLLEEETLKKLDEQVKRLKTSRNWIIELMLSLWIKDGCKTLKGD